MKGLNIIVFNNKQIPLRIDLTDLSKEMKTKKGNIPKSVPGFVLITILSN